MRRWVPLARHQRIAVAIWIILGIALWNGVFEMMVVRGVKEYLFRAALHDAGRGPLTPIQQVMDPAVYHATWVATLWASIVVLAGMLTIRLAGGGGGDHGTTLPRRHEDTEATRRTLLS